MDPKNAHNLLAITPIDGRYSSKIDHLSQYFSEAALMRYRILVEVEWFIFLFNDLQLKGTKELKPTELRILRSLYEQFDVVGASRVKEIEKETNHDVKAIEYFMKENLKDGPIEKYLEFIHFACTSEDINNLSYSCMIRDFVQRDYAPVFSGLVQALHDMAMDTKKVAMMSRTHGQPATPTTMGKELINVVVRLEREMKILEKGNFYTGKMNGAVGNFNAHLVAYPKVDWIDASTRFIKSLGLEPNLYTTQIEPHDSVADIFDSLK
ncbi:adenylosuccinate lyase, partial [Candidatus Gracilibacteria bacterium]|nr:adenylosuccinate lyase [Candidatus Gracilibacteria bacterium]